jgi:hypothetical protein
MSENKITLAKKLQELAKRGSDGEREAAQAALNKVLRKYDITLTDLDDEQENDYRFNYHGDEELKILSQIAYKVIGERGHVHPLVYTASNRRCRKAVDISCTEAQRIEIEFLFTFYTNLYKKEKEFFQLAFIQKHRLFPETPTDDGADDGSRFSNEELNKIFTMVDGLSDAQPNKLLDYKDGVT